MAKGEICIISNCTRLITPGRKGKICGTHQWRFRKFGQYDLPSHIGESNIPVLNKLPEGFVSNCEKHGLLKKDQTYIRYYKGRESSYYCKDCLLSINIKNKYKGMSGLDDYDRMLADQNGVCAMCKGPNNTTRNGKIKRFAVDHCHKSQKVRGLLCSFCNSLLGYAKDSIETLESAIRYLKDHTE